MAKRGRPRLLKRGRGRPRLKRSDRRLYRTRRRRKWATRKNWNWPRLRPPLVASLEKRMSDLLGSVHWNVS
jgi:hypothetical protein